MGLRWYVDGYRGFGGVIKRVKIKKIKGGGTTFRGLGRRRRDC